MARKQQQPRGTWREIQQKNRGGKTTTKVARQRRLVMLLRGAFIVLLVMAVLAGAVMIRYFGGMLSDRSTSARQGITEIDFTSDGVLTENWFNTFFPEVRFTDVRNIDVQELQNWLNAKGQVSSAEIALQLPSGLKVHLTERRPILRMRVREDGGNPITYLVSRDGHLYKGFNYPQDTLRNLPGVTGLRVRKARDGYLPIEGLEPIARLLDLAKERLPAMFAHWRLVDLSDWDPEVDYRPSLVKVSSTHIEEIIFSTYSISEQIDQLGGILERIERYQMGQPKSIDLSFGDEAVIRWE